MSSLKTSSFISKELDLLGLVDLQGDVTLGAGMSMLYTRFRPERIC